MASGIGQIVEIGLGGDIVPGGNQSKGVNGEETGRCKGQEHAFSLEFPYVIIIPEKTVLCCHISVIFK